MAATMSSEYPDVLGDLVEAKSRSEVSGVHYVTALEPQTIAPGEQSILRVWLQNCWDVPVTVTVSIRFPTSALTFSIAQKRTDIPLAAAEVGEVKIPILCANETPPRDYQFLTEFACKQEEKGLFIRSKRNEGRLGKTLLTFRTGMGLSATVGLGFVAQTHLQQKLLLKVDGSPSPATTTPDLTPTFLSHWTVKDLSIQGKARQQVNDQQLYLEPQLNRAALYAAFLEESQERYGQAGLPLHIGEAIFLAKILTFAVEYFLRIPHGYEAILLPAYTLAYRYDLPTSDPVFLVVRADYARMTQLAISLSFGLLREHLQRDPWSLEEQIAVGQFVSERVERPAPLPVEFLYLPLILGRVMVSNQVTMPGEDVTQSLSLLEQSRRHRSPELGENPDLLGVLDQLVATAHGQA
jgi:hypothetical protein